MVSNQPALTAEDWKQVVHSIPEFYKIPEVRNILKVVLCPDNTLLADDGMYFVISGEVTLHLKDDIIATAKGGENDYFFEEHLAIDGLKSNLEANALAGTRLVKLDIEGWRTLSKDSQDVIRRVMFGDLVNIYAHDFQQPINCCNITAAAFGLTALGYPTHIDDIFMDCKLPSAYVVNDGMTLGEVYDVACTYLHRKKLKQVVRVHCYYFDEDVVTMDHLIDAITESESEGPNQDILVANFGVGIAHNIPNNNGGHFSLVAKCNLSTGIVHMVDVHPQKYGKLWVTNLDRLYRAMVQRDSSSKRSRGLLRFTARSALNSELDALETCTDQIDMTDHLDITDDNLTSFFRDNTTNLNSIGNLALSLRLLGMQEADTDRIMQTTVTHYTEALEGISLPSRLAEICERYLLAKEASHVRYELLEYEKDTTGIDAKSWFKNQIHKVNEADHVQIIASIDLNRLMGCKAIAYPDARFSETAMSTDFWCICREFDHESNQVTMADCSCITSQFWRTNIDNLYEGLTDQQYPSLLLIRRN